MYPQEKVGKARMIGYGIGIALAVAVLVWKVVMAKFA
jgi:hypothetical protein